VTEQVIAKNKNLEDQAIRERELEERVNQRTLELNDSNNSLLKLIDDLKKMNIELESFNYISSHDLQEPLRKIQILTDRLLEKENEKLSIKGKDYFERIQGEAKQMRTLIQDLLAFSRVGTADRKFEFVDLNIIIDEVKKDYKEVIEDKNAVIEVKELCKVKTIPFLFRQLMCNLINNALKFSNPKIPPHIIISSQNIKYNKGKHPGLTHNKEYFHLTITDNGIGFEKQFSEKIFEVFQRLHGKDKYPGTGIGLAIVKKIVENHNGIIIATSELNEGASFDIYLPIE